MAIAERGISYRVEMVQCKVDGSKHMTRRVIAVNLAPYTQFHHFDALGHLVFTDGTVFRHRYGRVGDWLYIKETYGMIVDGAPQVVTFKATPTVALVWPGVEHEGAVDLLSRVDTGIPLKWKSGRFMPKKFARIKDRIVGFAVERVQDITDSDVLAEGITIDKVIQWLRLMPGSVPTLKDAFRLYWDSINSTRGFEWNANPWVLVIKTEPIPQDVWIAELTL